MATFSVILDSCLVCDGRRVEPNDLIDIYLDVEKFPDAENPVRAVVLDVRVPQPPESILGKVALDVQAADEDMPDGVTELGPDDITYVKCVDCCVRNTERIEVLEEQIVGTQETLATTFPPFIPEQFKLTIFGVTYDTFTYQGELGGFPYFTNAGNTRTVRRIGDNWVVQTPGDTYVQEGGPVYLPWMLPPTTNWNHTGFPTDFGYSGFVFASTDYTITSQAVAPSLYNPAYQDDDLIIARDADGNIWYWNGTTWHIQGDIIPWNPATALPSARIGAFYRITTSGTVNGVQTWPGDIFWRNNTGTIPSVVQIGVAGTFANVGVTTNTVQVITASKTWSANQNFASVDINSGTIDAQIGGTLPQEAWFDELHSLGQTTLGTPLTPVDPATTPTTATLVWSHATTNFSVTETLAAPTANRTQTKPNASGYYAIVAAATGLPNISEVTGVVFGKATLVAGVANVGVTGSSATSICLTTPEGQGPTPPNEVTAFCSGGTLTIQSSDVADTRIVNYMVKI